MTERADVRAGSGGYVLLCFGAERHWYRRVIVAEGEVFASPGVARREEVGGRVSAVPSPKGAFDVEEVVGKLRGELGEPGLVVVRVDGGMMSLPGNLGTVGCPKVLVMGDTHHQMMPLRRMWRYANGAGAERFDVVVGEFNRNHLHFFREGGVKAEWLPAFTVSPYDMAVPAARGGAVAFAGSVGKFHPYRRWVLEELGRRGVRVERHRGSREEMARIYNGAGISLNVSLNGDLNLRVFEVMAAGGFLLTDRLAKASGLGELFREGEHFAAFSTVEELVEKIRYYQGRPEEALAIARAGQAAYMREHRPERKIEQLLGMVAGKAGPFALPAAEVDAGIEGRMAVYECLQELHRCTTALWAVFFPSVDRRVVEDAGDLPRMTRYWASGAPAQGVIKVLVCTRADVGGSELGGWLGRTEHLVVSDGAVGEGGTFALTPPVGFAQVSPHFPLLRRV